MDPSENRVVEKCDNFWGCLLAHMWVLPGRMQQNYTNDRIKRLYYKHLSQRIKICHRNATNIPQKITRSALPGDVCKTKISPYLHNTQNDTTMYTQLHLWNLPSSLDTGVLRVRHCTWAHQKQQEQKAPSKLFEEANREVRLIM